MGDDKIDPNTNPAEVPPKDTKTEMTEEELAKVSGGGKPNLYQATCTGTPIKNVTTQM